MSLSFSPQGSTSTPTTPDNSQIPLPPLEHKPEPNQLEDLSQIPQVETLPPPETEAPEQTPHHQAPETRKEIHHKKPRTAAQQHILPPPVVNPDPLTYQIEKIMEEGIVDAYQELTPVQKQEFKIKGEQTARQIRVLLQSARVKVKKIFELIFEWLKLLPGVNRFFLMQEAKIKTDKIMGLKHKK